MGIEHYIVCRTHLERLRMGKLQFLEDWVNELVKSKNINLVRTPTPLQAVRKDVKRFRERHNTKECRVELINDHADFFLEFDLVFFRYVDYDTPLLTKEQIDEHITKKRDELIKEEYKAMRDLEELKLNDDGFPWNS